VLQDVNVHVIDFIRSTARFGALEERALKLVGPGTIALRRFAGTAGRFCASGATASGGAMLAGS
jgi:hypothetical protein